MLCCLATLWIWLSLLSRSYSALMTLPKPLNSLSLPSQLNRSEDFEWTNLSEGIRTFVRSDRPTCVALKSYEAVVWGCHAQEECCMTTEITTAYETTLKGVLLRHLSHTILVSLRKAERRLHVNGKSDLLTNGPVLLQN